MAKDTRKSDIITIVPAIRFDTEKRKDFSKAKIVEYSFKDYFKFQKAEIFSFKKFKEDKVKLPKYHTEQLNLLHSKIIDGAGERLEDCAIIFEKDIERKSLDIIPSDAEELLYYFANRQNITHWVQLGNLKIECMHGAGRTIYINNKMEHYAPKYDMLIPIEQNSIMRICYRNTEETLTRVLESIYIRNPEEFARLFRAIRLYNSACQNEYTNRNSSIVLLAAALEALFDYAPPSTKEKFSYASKVHLGFSEKVEVWAEEFYRLRSFIVHGSKVSEDDLLLSGSHQRGKKRSEKTLHQSHLEIAKDVFDECIFIQLENMGLVKIGDEYKHDRINTIVKRITPNLDKIDGIKDKRFNFASFKKDKQLYREFILRMESFTATDYSASRRIKEVIKVICKLAKDWFEQDIFPWLEETKKRRGTLQDGLDSYGKSLKEVYDYLPILQAASYGHLDLDDRVYNILELCRRCEPVWHAKDKFNFTISEFLERTLRALFGTYQFDIGNGEPKGTIKRVERIEIK